MLATHRRCLIATIAALGAGIAAGEALATDKMKLAVGQCGNWGIDP